MDTRSETARGEALFSGGKLEEAKNVFEQIVKDDTNNFEAVNNLGAVYYASGDEKVAESHFLRALEIKKDYAEALNNIILLYQDANRWHDAALHLERLALINSKDTDALNRLAIAYLKAGNIEKPREVLAKSLKLNPDQEIVKQSLTALEKKDGSSKDSNKEKGKGEAFFNESHSPELAWPYLMARFSSILWNQEDINLLISALPCFSEHQRIQLLEISLSMVQTGIELAVFAILNSLSEIPNLIAEQVGKWMTEVQPERNIRDKIEDVVCLKCENDDIVKKVAARVSACKPEMFVPGPRGKIYPRRLTSNISQNDPFMKYVPGDAPSKDKGIRILIISDYNVTGQLTALMRALNRYTCHVARCVIYQEDYLSYDKDIIIIRNQKGKVNQSALALAEACDLIRKADFFHIGRRVLPFPGIEWGKYISPRNAVFQYYGSYLRNNTKALSEFHAKSGYQAITGVDWTMYKLLQASFYHIQPFLLEIDQLPSAEMDFSGPRRICHAPSNALYRVNNGTDQILDLMQRISSEISSVEPVLIEGVANQECLRMKSRCHLHINSLTAGLGFSSIESSAMGVVPITPLDNFTRLLFPDTPVIHATEKNIYEVVKKLLSDNELIKEQSQACREWARREFDAKLLVKKYCYLYDLIYNGLSIEYPEIL